MTDRQHELDFDGTGGEPVEPTEEGVVEPADETAPEPAERSQAQTPETAPDRSYPPVVRRSPVLLPITPIDIEDRDGWQVVLEYEDEGDGPWLIDLSHRARWDYQDGAIDDHSPFGLTVPADWGSVGEAHGLLINRMNRTQASIWHIGPDDPPATAADVGVTDTTDSHCWLALIGDDAPRVMEAISNLDLFPPVAAGGRRPRLFQGPVLHTQTQIVAFASDAALMTVARGYGQNFFDAVLHSTVDLGLRPAGERVFTRWVESR